MESIMRAPLPQKFVLATFMFYSGETNPIEHIWNLRQAMLLVLGNDTHLYRAFPHSLSKKVVVWYWQPKPNNINASFKQLSTEFMKNYMLQDEEPKSANYLLKVIRRPRETFRNYIITFETALLAIVEPNHPLTLKVFKKGLLTAGKSLEDHR